MNEKWMKLIEVLEENGYTPQDIQRIIMYYEMVKDVDRKINNLFEDEGNERLN